MPYSSFRCQLFFVSGSIAICIAYAYNYVNHLYLAAAIFLTCNYKPVFACTSAVGVGVGAVPV